MAAPGQDPNKIDVSLNIMSDATLAAVNNLAGQLSSLREFLAVQSQGASDPSARVEGLSRAASFVQTAYTTGQVPPNRPTGPILGGDPSNPSRGAQLSAARRAELQAEYRAYIEGLKGGAVPERPLQGPARELMEHEIGDIQRWRVAGREKKAYGGSRLDRFFGMYQGAQRDPGEDRSYEFEAGLPSRGESALPEVGGPLPQGISSGASVPPIGGPGWAQALQREGITPDTRIALTIPRLGEFTIQDKLNMAAQWMGRAAQRRGSYDPEANDGQGGVVYGPTATRIGRGAAGAAYLRDQSAALVEVGREFQRLKSFARGEELSGEALGFSRESTLGDVEAFGIGGRLNLGFTSAAQREALRQEISQRRVQAAPGVSGEEAQRIRQAVSGMGYSGALNERLQLDLFKPLQQRGIGVESVAPLIDQGIRQGNASIAALKDTMIALADAARTANMTLEETNAAALEYAESVQEIGASYDDALRNAATFTASGLDPRIASQAMQSPMVQGQLTAQTGLAPQMQGIISASGVMRGMQSAAQLALGMGSVYRNLPDRTITTASGERLTTATGEDAQLAFASQVSGIPRQVLERMQRNPNFLGASGDAQEMASQLAESVRAATHGERTVTEQANVPGGRAARFGSGGSRTITRTESYRRNLTEDQRQALEHGRTGDGVIQYDELERQMIEMDPKNKQWTDRVRKIRSDHSNIEDRLGVAQRIIGEAVNVKPEPDYIVGLTDEARKILKIEKPKDRTGALPRANAGGAPANSAAMGPNFNSATGGAMSYGRPGP